MQIMGELRRCTSRKQHHSSEANAAPNKWTIELVLSLAGGARAYSDTMFSTRAVSQSPMFWLKDLAW